MGNSMNKKLFILLVTILGLCSLTVQSSDKIRFIIRGQIFDIETKEPIRGANIKIVDEPIATSSHKDGVFSIRNLKRGTYQIRVSHLGYETKYIKEITLASESEIKLTIELVKKTVTIKGITVTPGLYSITDEDAAVKQTLSRNVIETRPQLGDDLFRAVQRLPGISYNDFSAKFTIRGGEQDELNISLDGMELYEPFHLRDIDGGVISIVNLSAVQGVEFMTGGYPANYGDRMSGIIDIKSKTPSADIKHISVGLSAMNAKLFGEGSFASNKGSWLFSGRRGYLDLILKVIGKDQELKPHYYDIFSKVQYKLHDDHILSASILHADDNFSYEGAHLDDADNQGDTLISSYGNSYYWLTLYSALKPKLSARSIISYGRVSQERKGQLYDINLEILEMEADDNRNFDFYGVKTDWEYVVNDNHLLKTGLDYKYMSADYSYDARIFKFLYVDYGSGPIYQLDEIENRQANISTSGNKFSSYLTYRFRIINPVTAELGVRHDYSSITSDNILSPRFNLAVNISSNTTARIGWGHFNQTQRIDEIYIQDGESVFQKSEKAEHFVVGFEKYFETGEDLRIQAYYKKYHNLNPSYRNTFGELVSFPELEEDRVRVNYNGKASKGIELYVKKDTGGKLSWWFSYVLSQTKDDIRSLYYFKENTIVNYNKKFAFVYDQLHTIYLDMNYRPNKNWQFNLAWQYHTGWPYTDVFITSQTQNNQKVYLIQSSEPWSEKLEPFKRLDLRVNRKFKISKGTITAYIEVLNVLAETNIRNYEYQLVSTNRVLSINKVGESWFTTIPSFGIVYDYYI